MEDFSCGDDILSCLFALLEIVWAFTWAYTKAIWKCIVDIANEPFALNLVGVAVAAFAGTYGAQLIIKRNKKHDDVRREILTCNTAIATAFDILIMALSYKREFSLPLKTSHDYHLDNFKKKSQMHQTGGPNAGQVEYFVPNLKLMNRVIVTDKILLDKISTNISADARAVNLCVSLNRSIETLNSLILERNQFIPVLVKLNEQDPAKFTQIYLGLPSSAGHLDQRYPDLVNNILEMNDDAIYHSYELAKELNKHAKGLRDSIGKDSPGIGEITILEKDSYLLPDREKYAIWESSFVQKKKPKTRWYKRFLKLPR